MQRTIPLWDCGEYIACAYTLGIAHPPGNPLFLLIGRIFSILPIATDISHRVNLLSVFSGAVAATFGYAVLVRLMRFIPQTVGERWREILMFACATSGALLLSFGRTGWSNSVEAEVYSLAMLIYFALLWLALKWYDNRDSGGGVKYLLLMAYLGVLSVAVHMTTFLAMPVIFLFVILVDEKLRRDWRWWVSGIILFTVSVNVSWFLWIVPAWGALSLIMTLKERSTGWALSLGLAALAIIGFSAHGYIPIRAAEKPRINQNAPASWERFYAYLGRKQYGQESMFEKMFKRRASWENQLGDFPRIGFGGFLMDQFGLGGLWFVVPFVLAMIGIIALVKWKWRAGLFFAAVLFSGTIGLVLYMNFADGSHTNMMTGFDRLEVRDRDYFFTQGFQTFGLLIGLGLFVVLDQLLRRRRELQNLATAAGLGGATLIFPAAAVSANFDINNRSLHYVAYDYAYNILMSCPPDAILFTSGDNDTFPLWCLQEVYGIRRDVKIANLSLIQTDWYQLQLKHELGVPITLTDEQLIWESPTINKPLRPFVDPLRGNVERYLIPYQDAQTRQLVTVADQMVEHIILANQWKYPIVFSGVLPAQVKYPLAEHSRRRGLLYEVVSERTDGGWDLQNSLDLFQNVYRATNLNNPEAFREEVATTLILDHAQTANEFLDYLDRSPLADRSATLTDHVQNQFPEFWQTYARIASTRNLSTVDRDALFNEYFLTIDKLIAFNPENIFYYQFKALALMYLGRGAEAIAVSERAYRINPVSQVTYRTLMSIYLQNGRRQDAVRISREYLIYNPLDQTARQVASGQF